MTRSLLTRSAPAAPKPPPSDATARSIPPPDETQGSPEGRLGTRHRGVLGITLAGVCLVHCLAAPVLLLLPFGALLTSELLEWLVLGVAVGLGAAITSADVRYVHGHAGPLALVFGAGATLAAGHLLEDTPARIPLIVAGALILASAHIVNLRLRAKSSECCARGADTADA